MSSLPKLLCLVGPTGSGKTAAALFAAVKNESGCLVDGGRERAALSIYDISGMDGFGTGGEQIASYELKDGLMVCKYHAGEPDEWDEDEEDWDEDEWDEDCDEPAWDYEEVYDPIAKKFIQK